MRILRDVITSLLKKPFTTKYPKEKLKVPKRFRTRMHNWSREKCIWCKLCERSCPTEAITIDKNKKTYQVNLSKCIFCKVCEEVCPTDAINLSGKVVESDERKQILLFE